MTLQEQIQAWDDKHIGALFGAWKLIESCNDLNELSIFMARLAELICLIGEKCNKLSEVNNDNSN